MAAANPGNCSRRRNRCQIWMPFLSRNWEPASSFICSTQPLPTCRLPAPIVVWIAQCGQILPIHVAGASSPRCRSMRIVYPPRGPTTTATDGPVLPLASPPQAWRRFDRGDHLNGRAPSPSSRTPTEPRSVTQFPAPSFVHCRRPRPSRSRTSEWSARCNGAKGPSRRLNPQHFREAEICSLQARANQKTGRHRKLPASSHRRLHWSEATSGLISTRLIRALAQFAIKESSDLVVCLAYHRLDNPPTPCAKERSTEPEYGGWRYYHGTNNSPQGLPPSCINLSRRSANIASQINGAWLKALAPADPKGSQSECFPHSTAAIWDSLPALPS